MIDKNFMRSKSVKDDDILIGVIKWSKAARPYGIWISKDLTEMAWNDDYAYDGNRYKVDDFLKKYNYNITFKNAVVLVLKDALDKFSDISISPNAKAPL